MDIQIPFLLEQRPIRMSNRPQLLLSPRIATCMREDVGLRLGAVSLHWIVVSCNEENLHFCLSRSLLRPESGVAMGRYTCVQWLNA
jgi:hypothetical protein